MRTIAFLMIGMFVVVLLLQSDPDTEVASIAGTPVTALHCQEDEAIFWTGIDTLGCVNAEEVD